MYPAAGRHLERVRGNAREPQSIHRGRLWPRGPAEQLRGRQPVTAVVGVGWARVVHVRPILGHGHVCRHSAAICRFGGNLCHWVIYEWTVEAFARTYETVAERRVDISSVVQIRPQCSIREQLDRTRSSPKVVVCSHMFRFQLAQERAERAATEAEAERVRVQAEAAAAHPQLAPCAPNSPLRWRGNALRLRWRSREKSSPTSLFRATLFRTAPAPNSTPQTAAAAAGVGATAEQGAGQHHRRKRSGCREPGHYMNRFLQQCRGLGFSWRVFSRKLSLYIKLFWRECFQEMIFFRGAIFGCVVFPGRFS